MRNTQLLPAIKARLKSSLESFGWPRIIIALFIVSLFFLAPAAKVEIPTALTDVVNRFGMNAILVLAMVPMVQAGCGLNFGLPIGVIGGLLGSTLAIEITSVGPLAGIFAKGFPMFFAAILISLPFAALFGWMYGMLLNKVKGDEMIIATYIGWGAVSFMSIMWLVLPYRAPTMIWAYKGSQLRSTIPVSAFYEHVLSDFLAVRIGDFVFPTGMIVFVAIICFLVWLFFRTKAGTAMTAVGSNPDYARASGVDSGRMRVLSVIVSSMLGAVGIVVYQQSYGFIQVYNGPLMAAFPAVAAILIGGASLHKASIVNVVIGTLLYQGMITMTPKVINSLLQSDMAEVLRIIIANGMILYALTRKTKASR